MPTKPAPDEQMPSAATPMLIFVALTASLIMLWYGLPGFVMVWLGLLLGAMARPAPTFTGKVKNGVPTPDGEHELTSQARYLAWQRLRIDLLSPWKFAEIGWPDQFRSKQLWQQHDGPWPIKILHCAAVTVVDLAGAVRVSWLAAAAAGIMAASIPQLWWPLRIVNGIVAAQLVVVVLAAARSRFPYGERAPVTTVTSSPKKHQLKKALLVSAAGTAAGAAAGFLIWWTTNLQLLEPLLAISLFHPTGPLTVDALIYDGWWVPAAYVLGGALAVGGKAWSHYAQAEWRSTVEARNRFRPIWSELKVDPEPVLLAVNTVDDDVEVFSFRCIQGNTAVLSMADQIAPRLELSDGEKIALMHRPNVDAAGQRVPGTAHMNEFDIIYWHDAYSVDLAQPIAAEDHDQIEKAELFIRSALHWALVDAQWTARMLNIAITPIHAEDSEAAAWATEWAFLPEGVSVRSLRQELLSSFAASAGCEVLIDENTSVFYLGVLTDPDAITFTEESQVTIDMMEALVQQSEWDARWGSLDKMTTLNAPLPQPAVQRSGMVGAAEVRYLPFVTLKGQPVSQFLGSNIEAGLATTLAGAPFVSVQYFPGGNDGARHSQAIAVVWSASPVPMSPQELTPPDTSRVAATDAHHWAATAMMISAFRSARLAQPDVTEIMPLTKARSNGHIWRFLLQLSDGVTLRQMQTNRAAMKSALRADWVRIGRHERGAMVVAGVDPSQATFVNERAQNLCLELNFANAFVESKLMSTDGDVPYKVSETRLPENTEVMQKTYILPAPLTVEKASERTSVVQSATNLGYLAMLQGNEPNEMIIECAHQDPLPTLVPFDPAAVLGEEHQFDIPLGRRINGSMARFTGSFGFHIALLGSSGAGKSAAASAFLASALLSGCRVGVIDPEKEAADFVWARPYTDVWADNYDDAGPAMEALVAEMERRRKLYVAYGKVNVYELPDHLRPPEFYIFLDEATELLAPMKPPPSKPMTGKAEENRLRDLALFEAKATVRGGAQSLAALARATGMHIIVSGQSLRSDVLDGLGNFKNQLARIYIGKASFGDLQSALREPEKAPSLGEMVPVGRAVAEPVSAPAFIIQFWYASTDDLAQMVQDSGRAETTDEERLNTDLFRTTGTQHEEWVVIEPDEAEDEVLDLGEFEISADDLSALMAETTDEEHPPAAPTDAQAEAAPPAEDEDDAPETSAEFDAFG